MPCLKMLLSVWVFVFRDVKLMMVSEQYETSTRKAVNISRKNYNLFCCFVQVGLMVLCDILNSIRPFVVHELLGCAPKNCVHEVTCKCPLYKG